MDRNDYTPRERIALREMDQHPLHTSTVRPELARSLIAKGAATFVDTYERKEWNHHIETLWVIRRKEQKK